MRAVICDLDGTLSLFNCRIKGKVRTAYPGAHERNPYDASTCENDTLNTAVAEVLLHMHNAGCHIIFCTGRDEKYRPQTEAFLAKHIPYEHTLVMRKRGDNRKDSLVKDELFEAHVNGRYEVVFVFDDRNQAVNFWRSKGLVCFQVAPGDF